MQEKLRYEASDVGDKSRGTEYGGEPLLQKIQAFEPVLEDAKQVSFSTSLQK